MKPHEQQAAHLQRLAGERNGVAVILGDMPQPETILGHPVVCQLVDWAQPVCAAGRRAAFRRR